MRRTASPYLQRLSTILNQRLQGILRTEVNRVLALKKAESVLRMHFNLIIEYSQRRVMPRGKKLSTEEKEESVKIWVGQALADFEKILDDRVKPV